MIELFLMTAMVYAQSPVSVEAPCVGDLAVHVEAVRDRGDPQGYRCLWTRDDAGVALVARLDAGVDDGVEAVSRALAVHMMQRLDKPVVGAWVRRLNGADRRLLQDAIHARAGRETPVPSHKKVFAQFEWYAPVDRYTDGRLSALDRANLRTIDHPPPPPPPEIAEEPLPQAPDKEGCVGGAGCSQAGGSLAWVWLPFAVIYWARRKTMQKAALCVGSN